jgi:hypothetical protein
MPWLVNIVSIVYIDVSAIIIDDTRSTVENIHITYMANKSTMVVYQNLSYLDNPTISVIENWCFFYLYNRTIRIILNEAVVIVTCVERSL